MAAVDKLMAPLNSGLMHGLLGLDSGSTVLVICTDNYVDLLTLELTLTQLAVLTRDVFEPLKAPLSTINWTMHFLSRQSHFKVRAHELWVVC